ncbi:MAG: excinuclease ABC subunit A, partial [Planctomycetota bacterium]
MAVGRHILLRGVEVHNLKAIDLDIPHRKLIVLCGLSGSGKSSLALDTLYAEGQRRYIESFSAYTRQFLERLEKPEAERIDGIPPAIAVTGRNTGRSSRSTVGTATETSDYLRLLYAKIGRVVCPRCGHEVLRDSPQSAAEVLGSLSEGTRYLIAFRVPAPADEERARLAAGLVEEGFVRIVAHDRIGNLTAGPLDLPSGAEPEAGGAWYVVVDRLAAGSAAEGRIRDSLETAFTKGQGECYAFLSDGESAVSEAGRRGVVHSIEGQTWRRMGFSTRFSCVDCQLDLPTPEPRLYSFNSPLGACPECEGFGNVIDIDMELIVPDPSKTLRDGAMAPWNSPAYAHELEELLELADDYGLPVDVPFAELRPEHLALVLEGVPERKFGGLKGFFAWLERRKYKMHVRVFLSRWRSYRPCPACGGARLRPEALSTQIGGRNIAEVSRMKIREAAKFLRNLELTEWERQVGRMMLEQVAARLRYLEAVGLGYLTLERTVRTLSGGEVRRVVLTSALGSSLVNMLYVLDEPSIGLHPRDIDRLIDAIAKLRNRGNTVVVVEHEEAIIRAADQVIEVGPGAGERGGEIVFQGTPSEMEQATESLTGDYLARRRGVTTNGRRRPPDHGWIRLAGARGNNLDNITVEF